MKKTILVFAAGLVCSLATISFAEAQNTKNILLLTAGSTLEKTASPTTGINSRAMRDFKKNFPTVEGATWSSIKDGWVASFVQQDIRSTVVYNEHGDWQFTINYYGEHHLPSEVRAAVKSTYFDCSISGVEEVHVQDKTVYLVHLQDEKTWKKVRVYEGEMELIENFDKG